MKNFKKILIAALLCNAAQTFTGLELTGYDQHQNAWYFDDANSVKASITPNNEINIKKYISREIMYDENEKNCTVQEVYIERYISNNQTFDSKYSAFFSTKNDKKNSGILTPNNEISCRQLTINNNDKHTLEQITQELKKLMDSN